MRAKPMSFRRQAKAAAGCMGRLLLVALGLVLMVWGIGTPLVVLTGVEAEGRVTVVRRQLGDRGEAFPNRYAYAIACEFRLSDGTLRTGTSQRIGDFFSPGQHKATYDQRRGEKTKPADWLAEHCDAQKNRAPTAPIPVQTMYAVPGDSTRMDQDNNPKLTAIATRVMIEGSSRMKLWESFMV